MKTEILNATCLQATENKNNCTIRFALEGEKPTDIIASAIFAYKEPDEAKKFSTKKKYNITITEVE
jgi:hypothetical protein